MPDDYTSIRVGDDVYVHLKQDKTDECTVCCAGMIIARKKAQFVSRAELRTLSQNVGPANSGYRPLRTPRHRLATPDMPRWRASWWTS